MNRTKSSLMEFVCRKPLISFFVLAYAVSWILWLPVIIFRLPAIVEPYQVPSIYILPGIAFGVTGSAFLITALTQGKVGVIHLLSRFVLWRVKLRWYVFAILGLPVIKILIGFIMPGGGDALSAFSPAALSLYPAAYFSHFYFGPLWEEAGWRGFALPRLQRQRGPLIGTLILGLLWGVWHLPAYLPLNIQASGVIGGLLSTLMFVLVAIAMAVIFTWVFNNTKGSLFLAILLHASIDGTATYVHTLAVRENLAASAAANIELGLIIGCFVLALILILTTRGRLSYESYQRQAESLDLCPSREG